MRQQHRAGANLETLGRDLLEALRNLAVAKLPSSGDTDPLADLPDHEAAELRRIAARPSGRDLMRLFKLMADAQEQVIRSPYPDLLLEMAAVRMATLAPVMDADELMRALGGAGGMPPAPPSAGGTTGSGARAEARAPEAEPGARRIRVEGEVKADAPRRGESALTSPSTQRTPVASSPPTSASAPDLPELREHIRSRRAALAGFMEQGATLALDGDVLRIIPRNDIYIRYLNDNRTAIAELAAELYGRRLRVEVAVNGVAAPAAVADAAAGAADAGAPHSTRPPSPDAGTVEPRAAENPPPAARTASSDRQAVYTDPVARRIFDEFQARLVDVRDRTDHAPAPSTEPAADADEQDLEEPSEE